MKTWFTSDLHFGHDKEFLWGPRGFSSSKENDETIIERFNSVVSDEDEVYILGDLMLGDNEYGKSCVNRLKGHIHVILGNHDTNARVNEYMGMTKIESIQFADMRKYGKCHFYLSHYPVLAANYDDKPYHQHVISLFGHTHQQEKFYDNNPYMYHVGVDSHNCYPVEIDTIIEDIKQKKCEINNERMRHQFDN